MQNELKKQYAGVFDEWKIDLALGRIRAIGFALSDWPDLMQELAIVMLEFRYDPAKANGATEETALYAVINRNLLYQLRTRCRESAKSNVTPANWASRPTARAKNPSVCSMLLCKWTSPKSVPDSMRSTGRSVRPSHSAARGRRSPATSTATGTPSTRPSDASGSTSKPTA